MTATKTVKARGKAALTSIARWGASKLKAAGFYEGASYSARVRSWRPPASDPTEPAISDGETLRNRSRDIVRRSGYAENGIRRYASMVVGTGIKPQFLHPIEDERRKLQQLWEEWIKECVVDGQADFYGLQMQVCESTVENGEALIRLRPRRQSDNLTVPLQLQPLEPDYLPFDKNERLNNGHRIEAGVEFDTVGRRVRYHLYREHPNGRYSIGALDLVQVPADRVLHVYEIKRIGQVRGLPRLAPILIGFNDLHQYNDAERLRKSLTARITHFIKQMSLEDKILPDEDENTPQIQPGSTVRLLPGEDIEATQAAEVGRTYNDFQFWNLHEFSACLQLAFHQLTNNASEATFSSIRAALNDIYRAASRYQSQQMIYQLSEPVKDAFIEAAVLAGHIDPVSYAAERREFHAVDWRPDAFAWIDPESDVNSQIKLWNNGLASRTALARERGTTAEQIDRENAEDQRRAESLGLVYGETSQERTAATENNP